MFGWLFKKKVSPTRSAPSTANASRYAMPTVQFDASQVTDEVRADIHATLRAFTQIPAADFDKVYQAALRGVSRGRDLSVIAGALGACDGVDRRAAAAIARHVANRSTAIMNNARQLKLGITHAIWRYSGAPCGGAKQNAAHKRLDGKRFSIAKGILVGKRRTWPGMDAECKCVQSPIIPGLD